MSEENPIIFISYSHDSDEHKEWVLKLATDLLIFQLFTKQYLAKLLHCMAWNYQAAKQKTFGSTGDCGQWNFLKAE